MAKNDYILGFDDIEIARLGHQHDVWQTDTDALYRAAEFSPGQTLLDLGCGPGFTTFDLCARVGKTGRIIAVDASKKFTDILNAWKQ